MALEGLHAAQIRIAEIQRRVGVAATAPARSASGAGPAANFQDVFSTAMAEAGVAGAAGTTELRPATVRAPGQYGKLVPPAELAAYGNGRVPSNALTPIGHGSHRLWAPAANAFQRMEADAAAAGVRIGVTDSYRSYDEQVDVARRKGLHSQGGLAATPGTSNHGWGVALDLDLDAGAQQWMRSNGWKYGFVEDVTREPWHWTYRPG